MAITVIASYAFNQPGTIALTGDVTGTGSTTIPTTLVSTLTGKTLVSANIVGTVTNNNAAAGSVGEYIESIVTVGSAVSLSLGSFTNVTSISLTAGDWNVTGLMVFIPGSAVTIAYEGICISLFSGGTSTDHVEGSNLLYGNGAPNGTANISASIPLYRVSVAAPTTVYLKAQMGAASGSPKASGRLCARRVR